jgi:hypothetical protein
MTRQPTTPEERERRADDKKDKRQADKLTEDSTVDRMIRESIEKHGA